MLRQKGNATEVMHSLKELVLCTMLDLPSLDIYKPATFQNQQCKQGMKCSSWTFKGITICFILELWGFSTYFNDWNSSIWY